MASVEWLWSARQFRLWLSWGFFGLGDGWLAVSWTSDELAAGCDATRRGCILAMGIRR